METSLKKSREALLEKVLGMLWEQWTLLGVPGQGGGPESGGVRRVIDPEALLLLTSEAGRYDARLMDEVIGWLRQYGRLVNIHRLKTLHEQHDLGNGGVMGGIAGTLLQKSRLVKWRVIEEPGGERAKGNGEALFRRRDGEAEAVFGEVDEVFKRHGYLRGRVRERDAVSKLETGRAEVLLVKLRALLGVNARAEILAALLGTRSVHSAGLARRIGYLPRSVHDTLNEMALSGHVVTERAKGARERCFALRPGDWEFLITWPEGGFPEWHEWAVVFALMQDALRALDGSGGRSGLGVALKLREVFERHQARVAEAGLGGSFLNSARASGAVFAEVFLEELLRM